MISLLRVELNRLRWRRAVVVLLAAAIVVPVVIFIAVAYETRPVSDAERAAVAEQVREEARQPYVQKELKRCLRSPENYGRDPGDDVQQFCEDMTLPNPDWYLTRSQLDLRQELEEGAGIGVAAVLAVLMLLIGTTFVGHDWNTGSMGNQLLFESRRARVWLVKGATVLGVGAVISGLVLFSYWGGLLALAHQRDLPFPDGVVSDGYAQALRATVLAAAAGLAGYVLTMLFRSTVATLGILFAVSVAVPILFTVFVFPGHISLQPQNNGWALIRGGVEIVDYDDEKCWDDPEAIEDCVVEITTADASLYVGGLLLATGVPSLLLYRRRDVP
jgi:ABC-2 type transport system permease protein